MEQNQNQDQNQGNNQNRGRRPANLHMLRRMVQKRKAPMVDFVEKQGTTLLSNARPMHSVFRTTTDVELHTTRLDEEKPTLFSRCMHHCMLEIEPLQKCGFYCSAILLFFPGLKDVAVEALSSSGARVLEITDGRARALDDIGGQSQPNNLVYLGQLLLLLYKNISPSGYRQFFTNRTNAMKAHAGVLPYTNLGIAVDETTAVIIKRVLGSKQGLRIAVLNTILALREDLTSLGKICDYLSGILAWTEMAPLTFINDMLLVTKSPIITDPSIQKEVFNRAFTVVKRCEFPQYFKITAPSHEARLIERSQFPVLIAVAQTLKGKQDKAVTQFYQQTNVNQDLVA